MALTLTTDERAELERRVRSLKIRAEDARRARVILMLADGDSYSTIEATVPCYRDYINRWRRRFLAERLEGLRPRYRGQPPTVLTPRDGGARAGEDAASAARRQHALEYAQTGSPAEDSSQSRRAKPGSAPVCSRIASSATCSRTIPTSRPKAADVIGLYVNPPDHAAVFAVDEKTAIQALDRLDPVLPLSPGRAERHGFEYYRHGTLSLFAALNTQSGEVLGQTVPRHTSAAFVEFLGDIVASQPKRREIHVIADNLSTHKTQAVRTFLLDASERASAFHADLFVLAQPSRTLVCEDRARPARARHLHVRRRPGAQDSSLHPPLQQGAEADPLGLSQSGASNW